MVEGEVKWLYPGATDSAADIPQLSEMESDLQTDQSVHGSETEASSPTSSGPELDTGSTTEDLPLDNKHTMAELGEKMNAASNYVGSFFQSSSWYSSSSKEESTKEESSQASSSKEKEEKGSSSSTFSTAFFNTLGKVGVGSKSEGEGKEGEEEKVNDEGKVKEDGKVKDGNSGGLGYLSSAFSKIGLSGITGSSSSEKIEEEKEKTEDKEKAEEPDFFSNAFSKVGKAASSYTKVLQDTVSKAPMLSDFNQEQENFIKSKGDKDMPTAPWSGYQNEDELKEKILALSLDQRNFLRAPPSGVEFDMESAGVSAHALVLLKEDVRLEKIRYELVPKKIKEEEFWRNYFYRVGVIKQSFELNNMTNINQDVKSGEERTKPVEDDTEGPSNPEHDDEFVSDSHQVSSKDLAEADEAMKKLGLGKCDSEWEAELEGELDGELEYEMVQGDGQLDNPEWEEQIQEMLAAETEK